MAGGNHLALHWPRMELDFPQFLASNHQIPPAHDGENKWGLEISVPIQLGQLKRLCSCIWSLEEQLVEACSLKTLEFYGYQSSASADTGYMVAVDTENCTECLKPTGTIDKLYRERNSYSTSHIWRLLD